MSDELKGHELLVAELRGVELEVPARLRARVLALEPRRHPRWRLAAVVAAAALAGAAIGGGVARSSHPSASPLFATDTRGTTAPAPAAPKATRVQPEVTSPPIRRNRGGWTTTDGALAGAGGGLVLGGLGIALVRLRRRSI